jgi:release factor glutamine methyltransferase
MTVGALYRNVRAIFREAGLDTPDLDARVLVAAALGISSSDVLLREDDMVSEDARSRLEGYCSQRLERIPVGRILGEREFWGLPFSLNSSTLEPRPDTETLVEAVLKRTETERPVLFADIGTGTGAIAIALLSELPSAKCVAVDLSADALVCAVANADKNGVAARFQAVQGDFAAALGNGLDWVISNPPYIRTSVVAGLELEVRKHDPALALDGGEDGLDAYRIIAEEAASCLGPGGRIALEIGFDQADQVAEILQGNGFLEVEIIQDLAGNNRVIIALQG